jgi:hypothetical protein
VPRARWPSAGRAGGPGPSARPGSRRSGPTAARGGLLHPALPQSFAWVGVPPAKQGEVPPSRTGAPPQTPDAIVKPARAIQVPPAIEARGSGGGAPRYGLARSPQVTGRPHRETPARPPQAYGRLRPCLRSPRLWAAGAPVRSDRLVPPHTTRPPCLRPARRPLAPARGFFVLRPHPGQERVARRWGQVEPAFPEPRIRQESIQP